MKKNYGLIYTIFIFIILFLELGFFNLVQNLNVTLLPIVSILSIIIFLIFLTQPNKKKVPINIKIICILLLILYGMYFFILQKNAFFYSTDLCENIYRYNNIIFIILYCFPLYEAITNSKNNILKMIFNIGMFLVEIRGTVWLLKNFIGITLLPGYFNGTVRSIGTFSLARISVTFIEGFLIVFALNQFFDNSQKNKRYYLFSIIYLYFYAIFVTQTRTELLAFLGTTFLMLFIKFIHSKQRALLIISMVIFITIISFIFRNNINEFIYSFSPQNTTMGISTQARLDGLQYLFEIWNSRQWNGLGFLPDQFLFYNVRYYLSDYGIIVTLLEFGIVGFLITLLPILLGVYYSFKFNSRNKYINYVQGLTIYIIILSVTMNLYWYEFIGILPIYLALIMECIYYNNIEMK